MSKTYKTLTGYHFLGQTESVESLRALLADGHIPAVAKFVECSASYIASLENAFPADTLIIARWKYYDGQRWDSDKTLEWLASHATTEAAALDFCDMLRGELATLAAIPRTVYIEAFNEPELTKTICEFNLHVAKILHARYGAEVKLAALSLGAGRFNEAFQWFIVYENLIKPLNNAGIDFALALHCYSSLFMPAGNDPRYSKPEIQRIFSVGNPQSEMDLDTVPTVSLAKEPNAWTGFAHERAAYFLKVILEGLEGTPMLLTEAGIDDMKDPGVGGSAGGWRAWWERHFWDRLLRPNETPGAYYARNLRYMELRVASFNKAGGNVLGITPFTYSDANPDSRWFREYRVIGDAWNTFMQLMKAIYTVDAPIPEEETLPTGIKLYWPVEDTKRAFNQAYGANVPYYSQWGLNGHEGIDFYAPHGTKIFACADGTVSVVNAPGVAGYQSGHNYGIHVRVKHEGGFETIYAHFQESKVSVGDTVKASQVIGIADSTGNSTGSHLHLTLKKDGVIINPTDYLVREFATPQVPTPITCDAVTTDALRVRSAPDTSKENVLFVAAAGATLTPTHQFIARGENWYRVIYTNNGIIGAGWCVARFTSRPGTCPVLPVWVEPTPEPEPVPEPNDALLAEIMPIFRRLQVDSVSMSSNVDDAMAVLTKYGVQD